MARPMQRTRSTPLTVRAYTRRGVQAQPIGAGSWSARGSAFPCVAVRRARMQLEDVPRTSAQRRGRIESVHDFRQHVVDVLSGGDRNDAVRFEP
jgi:hypothetical protein